jgi:hypothetical protein
MNSSDGDPVEHPRRWVTLRLQHRQVCLGPPEETRSQLSYAGLLIVHYEDGVKVVETWLPVGAEPSEMDDEELIHQLRAALRWQAENPLGES